MRSNTLLFGFSLLTGVLAADKVVTMYIPDNEDGQALAGKVIGSNSDTTTYSIGCADSVTESCEVPSGATFVQAPSSITIIAAEAEQTGTVACSYDDKIATCSLGIDGEWLATSTDSVLSYEVTVTATETGSSSKPPFGNESASPTPTTMTSSTTKDGSAQATKTDDTGAEETDGPDNGAMDSIWSCAL
ncbi:uncharacterized protein BDV17DRAFT_296096 [Aspergillus undulatus]|uniref:uncharacterized protein n=1 Tax=Aspergillus undulatus TaxID=1810928 RepID=UPI003CCD115B